jgi:hypothetical protein
MSEPIRKALNDGPLLLGFSYKNMQRWVEPHTYGIQPNGNVTLCAWQISGGSGDGYRLFLINEMADVTTGDRFNGPRPGYHRGDQRFSTIFAEL